MPDGTLSGIEQKVEKDRAAFEASLARLSDTLAPDRLKEEAARVADQYGSELGGQAWKAARENPAAFALVGAGLALLLSGAGRRSEDDQVTSHHRPPLDKTAADEADATIAEANASLRKDTTSFYNGPSAERLKASLHRGLESLSPDARARVLDARHAALRAQQGIEQRAAQARYKADRIVRQRPVATSAAAFGIGALIAAILPSTEREDALLGKQRDAMMENARVALETEMAKLRNAASSAMQDADQKTSNSQPRRAM